MTEVDIEAALKDKIASLKSELDSMQAGLDAIQGRAKKTAAPATKPSGKRRGRPPGSGTKTRRRTAKASGSTAKKAAGKRQQEFLVAVEKSPGLRAGDIGDKIGVSRPHAYALAKVMKEKKLVQVKNNQYFPAGQASPAPTKKSPAKKSTAKKSPAKKSAAKK